MRAFIAIDLPEEVKKELKKIQEQLKSEDIRAVFVKPEALHINLKFLGEITDIQANKIKEAFKKIKFEQFRVKLNSLGVFTPQFIRVLWIDIFPKEQLIKLQQQIDNGLEKEGFKREKRFETHITLARIKLVKDREAFIKKLKYAKIKPIEFKINGFSLKKSILTPRGPIYEDIIKF